MYNQADDYDDVMPGPYNGDFLEEDRCAMDEQTHTQIELEETMNAADWHYAIDAQNFDGCWENLENIRHCMQGGWQGGYELYRWYISLKTCPNKKYKLIRLTLDKGDGNGPFTVCSKELID